MLQRVSGSEIRVSIQNAGMGPMRIQKIVLLENESDSIDVGVALEEAFPADFKPEVFVHHFDDYVLAPLQQAELFRCAYGTIHDETATRLKSVLNDKFLGISYSDIYDDVYEKKIALNAVDSR
ncbi:MAG: hypothetical protein PHW41_00795 [Eubacteriales bacterium]|nr:hypothetical protein [Eubacteriales bacterium]